MNTIFLVFGLLFFAITVDAMARGATSFDDNYVVPWGQDHVLRLNQGNEVQLSLDRSSGARFESKHSYGSGYFQMKIKVPPKDSSGIVTAFYLTSTGNKHDEVDFEFLGNRGRKPITLQTNVFVNGIGNREQRIALWFDPAAAFHTYGILWNSYHIVFYVDKVPIRIFKNNIKFGASYPSKPMQVMGALWNGESWATDGGKIKINWAYAPFKAYFQQFSISGCDVNGLNDKAKVCSSTTYWWNTRNRLSAYEQKALKNVRAKYMTYDYCSDRVKFHVPNECRWNQ